MLGTISEVRRLLEIRPPLSIYTAPSRNTALHAAAYKGHVEILELLLEPQSPYCARLETPGKHGKTALYQAVEEGQQDAVKLLLREGASPNQIDDSGRTLMNFAINELDSLDIAQILVENEGEPASPTFECASETIEFINASARGDEQAVKDLLDNDTAMDSKDGFGFTALYYAARPG